MDYMYDNNYNLSSNFDSPQDETDTRRQKIEKSLSFYRDNNFNVRFKLLNGLMIVGSVKNLTPDYVVISNQKGYSIFYLTDIDNLTIINANENYSNLISFLRESISPSLRFKILNRDKYTCQYCGGKAPEVELEIDHIQPVSYGGLSEENNLITSCKDCNQGKSNKFVVEDTEEPRITRELS